MAHVHPVSIARPTSSGTARTGGALVCSAVVAALLACPGAAHAQSVGSQADLAHSCSTGRVASWELQGQLAAAENCWYPTKLTSITAQPGMSISPSILHYASPETRDAIYAASRTRSFNVNSAFRTLLDQYYLYTARAPACMAVAAPGRSNHESGTAVDVSPDGYDVALRSALEGVGCRWLGSGDRVHFDCLPRSATRYTTVTFQRLWNLNHPEDRIAEDNSYGPITLNHLRASPIHGFATMPCDGPPPCDDTAGPFTFSCDGENAGAVCVSLNEAADPDSWSDNYLCSTADVGFVFSTTGPIDGMRCTNTTESADAHADAWADNHACVPSDSPLEIAWSSAGPMAGWDCVRWNEPADPGTWTDNYLCTRPSYCFTNAGFTFCSNGAPAEGACIAVDEAGDPDTWSDNFFCAATEIGMVWSNDGDIDGMTCVAVNEPSDTEATAWADNYLCLPDDSAYAFTWSSAGPLEGMDCVRWYESADADESWTDNYLCVSSAATSAPDAGASVDAAVAGRDAATPAAPDAPLTGTCSCRAVPSRTTTSPTLLFLALGLWLGVRRRTAARRARRHA